MIDVTTRYFAAFREQAGVEAEQISTKSRTVAELYAEVSSLHSFRDERERCKVAVNGTMTDWNAALADRDEVLFFPPVAGG